MWCLDTISQIREFFDAEPHEPMRGLVRLIESEEWASGLRFGQSMYSLRVARLGRENLELLITYGDGRQGGRPTLPYLDRFDVIVWARGSEQEKCGLTASETVKFLARWLETAP
jgi:hypothetical protein